MLSRKNSRTVNKMLSATRQKEVAIRALESAVRSEKIASACVKLKDMLENYMEILSIEEIRDVLLELEESVDNHEEFKDVQGFNSSTNNPLATDTSEDEYIEVSDDEGGIDAEICDEVTFSQDGQEANKQLVKRLLEEQDLYFKSQCIDNQKYHYITKGSKELTIQNFSKGRYQYGLLTDNTRTPPSDIVNNWERFGNKKSKRKEYDFKGKNIEEVVQMIHGILD